MRNPSFIIICTIIITFSAAQAFSKDYSIGVKTGTLGIGIELTKPIRDSLDFRIGINHIEAKVSNFKLGSIEYNVDSDANSINAILDWHLPRNKKFYLSGGFLFGKDHIKPTPTPDFVYNGIKIGQALNRYKVDLKVDYKDIAPYFSIGYSNRTSKKKGWHYNADLGFAFLGKPKTDFNIIDKTTGETPASIPQALLDSELKKINDKLRDYKVWPILSVTWSYQF